jgi:hypothetical protein
MDSHKLNHGFKALWRHFSPYKLTMEMPMWITLKRQIL